MEVLLWVVGIAAWVGCGHVSIALYRGWKFYTLYPKYPILGTPEKQEQDDGGISYRSQWFSYVFGPIDLLASAIVFRTKPKWR